MEQIDTHTKRSIIHSIFNATEFEKTGATTITTPMSSQLSGEGDREGKRETGRERERERWKEGNREREGEEGGVTKLSHRVSPGLCNRHEDPNIHYFHNQKQSKRGPVHFDFEF